MLGRRTVFGFLRARLTDRSQADDLCQEVFIRLYLGRDKLDRASAVGPWLIGTAADLVGIELAFALTIVFCVVMLGALLMLRRMAQLDKRAAAR